jgi:16S rRNA (cytosine1402-N4)-methyltransferase
MVNEMINYLDPQNGKTYVDCTFGAGGYATAITNKADVTLIAVDCDPDTKHYFDEFKSKLSDKSKAYFVQSNFGALASVLESQGIDAVDGIVMDLGVSSMQLDTDARGFSFNKEARLDMRMNQSGYSAYEFINSADEKQLANVIYELGDEKNSRRIAKSIVIERSKAPIETTTKLAEIIRSTFRHQRGKIDLATKTFQAIRIFINDELESLRQALSAAEKVLKHQGRLVVISFHSLEDSIVKAFIRGHSQGDTTYSRYQPIALDTPNPTFKNLTSKAVKPSDYEVRTNPRARSARLRAAIRI